MTDPLDKLIVLNAPHDRNESLFFRALCDNIDEMQPLVYTPRASPNRSRVRLLDGGCARPGGQEPDGSLRAQTCRRARRCARADVRFTLLKFYRCRRHVPAGRERRSCSFDLRQCVEQRSYYALANLSHSRNAPHVQDRPPKSIFRYDLPLRPWSMPAGKPVKPGFCSGTCRSSDARTRLKGNHEQTHGRPRG